MQVSIPSSTDNLKDYHLYNGVANGTIVQFHDS